ncbi:MAG: hypothetical protein ACXADX_08485 [Candidatus Hodarchaeales archaeon]
METPDLSQAFLFFSDPQDLQNPDEILKFDICRRRFRKRLQELQQEDPGKAAAFEPIMTWMQLFISMVAPELLNDDLIQEI